MTSASKWTECDSIAMSPTAHGPVAEQDAGGDEDDRTGHIQSFETAGQHGPCEEEDDEGDQGAGLRVPLETGGLKR